MIASVHLADVGFAGARRSPASRRRRARSPGLRHANVGAGRAARRLRRSVAAVRPRRARRVLGRRRRARPVPRATIRSRRSSRRAGTFGSRRCARTARGPGFPREEVPDRAPRRARGSGRRAHDGPAAREPADPVPAHEREGRSERGRRARPDLGDRARAPAVVRRDVLAVGVDARALDLRVRAPGSPRTPTRSRTARRSRSTTSRRSSASAPTASHGHLDGKNPLADLELA